MSSELSDLKAELAQLRKSESLALRDAWRLERSGTVEEGRSCRRLCETLRSRIVLEPDVAPSW